MALVETEFETIDIAGSSVLELMIDPLRRARMMVFTFPNSLQGTDGGKTYELHFSKIADFDINIREIPVVVVSHQLLTDSEVLNKFRSRPPNFTRSVDHNKVRHFHLEFDHGSMDLIAEEFSCLLISET